MSDSTASFNDIENRTRAMIQRLPTAFHSKRAMIRLTVTAAATILLSGCASFSPDGGFDKVEELTRERTGQMPRWERSASKESDSTARVAELLREALTAESAVEIALLNNRGLQAHFSELGIAEADLIRAGRLSNPSFGFAQSSGGGVVETDRSIMFNILGLLTMPLGRKVEQQRFEQAQYQAALGAVGVAADARRAFFSAVASQELLKYAEQVKEAAEVSNELAQRMRQAGNFNKLAQMREQAFYADAIAQLTRAKHQTVVDRERLVRILSLQGPQLDFKLPERLPDLPQKPVEPRDAEQTAMNKRLDVLMARRATEATARALGLTKTTRMVNVMHAGYTSKSETGAERRDGYEIELELPIFDFGSVRLARAEASYRQSMNRTAEVALNARSEVRESYSAYRTAYDLARHFRDEIVPLRKRISEENLLRYNGMLIGVFDLLADAREQVFSVTGYVEALRDHWIAETNLQTALTASSPGAGGPSRPAPNARSAGNAAAH